MGFTMRRPPRFGHWLIAATAALCLGTDSAPAQAPGSGASPVPLSREELIRRYDLDSDGKISPSEAEVGRSKMRRDRLEKNRRQELDPVTGLPRGEGRREGESMPPEPPPKPITSIDDLLPRRATDGGRDDGVAGESAGRDPGERPSRKLTRPAPMGQGIGGAAKPGASAGPAPLNAGRPAPARPGSGSGPAMGGVRAGAPAARPGYGAIPRSSPAPAGSLPRKDRPLNAGRPIDSPLSGGMPAAGQPGRPPIGSTARPAGPVSGRNTRRGDAPAAPPRQPLLPDRSND
jgi:hypothetical protein